MNTPAPGQITRQNISKIAELEGKFLEQRTAMERIADAIGEFAGGLPFVAVHFIWFAVWVLINTRRFPGIPAFDPYPFTLLTLIVSCEGVILATFVLMKQNRMSLRADHRAHLNLQVDLLAEQETTTMLEMLGKICDRMGMSDTAERARLQELTQETRVEQLSDELKNRLSDR